MTYIQGSIERIKKLLSDDSVSSATYAALEARLVLEKICYDRLRICHNYISHEELKKWQPADIINRIIQEVDERIASEFTFYISPAPVPDRNLSQEDFVALEWVPLGTQSGFDPKKIKSLWNALSNIALHVQIPKYEREDVSIYGNNKKIRSKIDEAISEIERISRGNLISSGLGSEVHFTCECGHLNKRREKTLRNGKIIQCTKLGCKEIYEVDINGEDYSFKRQFVEIECQCGHKTKLPKKHVLDLQHEQIAKFICLSCNEDVHFSWRLMRSQASP